MINDIRYVLYAYQISPAIQFGEQSVSLADYTNSQRILS